jgi:RNA polymerase sigma factor (sigma-70 family)
MRTSPSTTLLGQLRGAFLRRELSTASDAQLLTRYLREREESAFEAILRRHGAMVLGICRRILGDEHEAEDAFQAVFLVLVHKAASIMPRERLGCWLHGVAQRTARKARTARARWAARGRHAMTKPSASPDEETEWRDLQPILDEELAALAENYRLPIILCDLEGKSRKEAAEQLSWKEGTLSGRLARGRRLLAARLTRRGVVLSAAALTARLTSEALAVAPSPALLDSTSKAAFLVAAGTLTGVAAPVHALMRKVLQTMLIEKPKSLSLLLIPALLGIGAVVGYSHVWGGAEPPVEVAADKEKPAPAAENAAPANLVGKLYMHRGLDLAVYDLRWKQFTALPQLDKARRVPIEDRHGMTIIGGMYQPGSARLSPDGRFLAFGISQGGSPPNEIQIREVNRDKKPRSVVRIPKKELSSWCWSPDGKQILFSVWPGGDDEKYHPHIVEVATGKVRKVMLPELKGEGGDRWGAWVHAWSPDGLWLVFAKGRFFLAHPQTKDVRQVTHEPTGFFAGSCRFSPDGKKVVFIGGVKEKQYELYVIDLLLGKTKLLAKLPNRWDFAVCWSPDSHRIALSSIEVNDDFKRKGPSRVEIYEADGKGRPRRLIEEENESLTVTDWR